MQFEWDPDKAAGNQRKHGVRFAEATTVLEGSGLTMLDETAGEERFVDLGLSSLGRVLVVIYTIRGDRIRIISARKASTNERAKYEAKGR